MELFERELNYRGETTTVYFREMNGGEQLALTKGQKMRGNQASGEMEVDLYSSMEAGQKLVEYTLVNSEGKKVYSSASALQKENTSKISRLIVLAREAAAHFQQLGEEPEGNVSTPTPD